MSDNTLKPDVPKPGLGLPMAVLKAAAGSYAKAVGGRAVNRLSESAGNLTDRLTQYAEGGGSGSKGGGKNGDGKNGDGDDDGGGKSSPMASAVAQGASKVAEGGSPVKAGLSAVGTGLKETVKGIFGRGEGGGGKGSGNKKFKFNNIVEAIDVGAPVDVVYDAWTTYDQWPDFMKKLEKAELDPDEGKAKFKGQVFWSHREWETTIKEQVPDRRIVWDSSGPKGHISGAVTFHELADDLTRIVIVLEYHPQGFMEKTANIWRAANRRVRLELKFFVRYVMKDAVLHPDDFEGFHAEIHDGEIVRSHEDALADREEQDEGAEDEGAEGAEGAEGEGAEDYDAGYDEEYEPESREGDDGAYDEGEYDEEEPADEYDEEDYGDEGEEADEGDGDEDYAEDEYAEDEEEPADEDEEEADDEAASQEPAPARRRSRR